MNSQILNFDMFAMVQPKNERDFEMMLDEAMAAICSVNEKLQAPNSGTDGAVIKVKESVQVATVLPFKKGES